ncbi:hypothetical protein OUZ56_033796 [Daphnia magna]|uniref:Uncharacterized protein n=1 Tax=Daphnia magna TaxID=35525 RepID=A0ABR0BB90_9CRUS|nr:hypothetical protein OUZ56_033796 [Daphnia magna]
MLEDGLTLKECFAVTSKYSASPSFNGTYGRAPPCRKLFGVNGSGSSGSMLRCVSGLEFKRAATSAITVRRTRSRERNATRFVDTLSLTAALGVDSPVPLEPGEVPDLQRRNWYRYHCKRLSAFHVDSRTG